MEREAPHTTLFMLMSVDGKISTGAVDERDFDKDLPNVPGVAEGLAQYYKLEKKTDYYSFNTGRVFAKVGWNDLGDDERKIPAKFVIIDNKPHLTETGIHNLVRRTRGLLLATTNPKHPALSLHEDKLQTILCDEPMDLNELFAKLGKEFGIRKMTVQSGGTMTAELLRSGLIDELSVVVAPILVGGRDTSTLVDGTSLLSIEDLTKIKTLTLLGTDALSNSYLHLKYRVN